MSAFDNYALMERELPPRASALKTTKPQEKMTSNPAAATGLLATIEVAFLSGAYSDLVIQCHGRVFKAHKLIVCGQSEWFAKAVQKDGFQEGQTGVIDLPFDDPAVVKALLQYLYTFDYNVPEHLEETIAYAQARAMQSKAPASDKPPAAEDSNNGPSPEEPSIETTIEAAPDGYGSYGGDVDLTGSSVEASALGIGSYRPESHSDYLWRMYHRSQHLRPRAEDEQEPRQPQTEGEASTSAPDAPEPEYDERALPPMLFHINVYALADRVQNKPLKTLAETKFEALAKKEWKSPDFPSAIEAIYSVAPPGSTGDSLRKMIVRLVVSHAKELFNLDRGFTSMLQDTPDFAADLARALSGAGISAKGAELNIDVEELCCPGCKFIMKAAIAQSVTMLTCPICRWEGIVSRWRHGQKEQGTLKKGRRSVLTSSWEL